MSESNEELRPLRAGLWIRPAKPNDSGGLTVTAPGTLTGLATRKSDGAKVLVTCKHVMAHHQTANTTGNEGMYQHTVAQNIMRNTDDHEDHPIDTTKKVGTAVGGLTNPSDVTICTIEGFVTASFALHTHAIRPPRGHQDKVVIAGTVDPVDGDDATKLVILGAYAGPQRATVIKANDTAYPLSSGSAIKFQMDAGHNIREGDSGAACLVDVGNNQYKMCGILLGRQTGSTVIGYAAPASDAENELGITFGIITPEVEGGSVKVAYGGERVDLQGSVANGNLIDSDQLTYQWEQRQVPGVPTVTLIGATSLNPHFTAPPNDSDSITGYTFKLTVTNEGVVSGEDIAFVLVFPGTRNNPPVANAGADQTVASEASVTLQGSASDPDTGDTITYAWEQVGTSTVTLSGATTSLSPTFMAPEGPTSVILKLTVTDNHFVSASHQMTITVLAPGDPPPAPPNNPPLSRPPGNSAPPLPAPPTNTPPVANAGSNQTVNKGDVVTLDGSGSYDSDGDTLTYRWVQLHVSPEPRVSLSGVSSASATFTAPTGPASLFFQLTVSDGNGGSDTDTVAVTVRSEIWGPWEDNGVTNEDPIAGWLKQQTRTSDYGNTETQWVAWPEEWPDTWTDTTDTRGSGLLRERKQTRTSNHGNTQTQWVPDPAPPAPPAPPSPPTPPALPPIIWRPWEDTGTTRGCGPSQEKEQRRTSNRGGIQHRWMSDSRPEVWGSWSGTGRTLGSGQTREAQESRTSNCNNTETRWVSDPEPETWGAWTDTGETMTIGAGYWVKEQARTSSYGNRETRWVAG